MKSAVLCGILAAFFVVSAPAQKTSWRQATASELASVLPSRAQVVSEHIETEMRTASGVVNDRGQYVAGVVLLTAGYSADGKYSHFLMVQVPLRLPGLSLSPGNYLLGWRRSGEEDALDVHINAAATGELVGNVKAKRIKGPGRVESIHIWPPQTPGLIQIGRFGIPYKLGNSR
ncbi:MAG TPA: hypothetical protein VF730_05470 [Terracidiphilus sp.]